MTRAPCVVDTSAWIEWLIGSLLGQEIGVQFPGREDCIVPTTVQLELAKWLRREADEDRCDQVIAYTQKCRVASLDTSLAMLAAEMHRRHKLATADAIVYATATQYGVKMLTCDVHFEGLPEGLLFPKVKTEPVGK